jgi:hypothetical protein
MNADGDAKEGQFDPLATSRFSARSSGAEPHDSGSESDEEPHIHSSASAAADPEADGDEAVEGESPAAHLTRVLTRIGVLSAGASASASADAASDPIVLSLVEHKVDVSLLKVMDDSALSALFPLIGPRTRIKAWQQTQQRVCCLPLERSVCGSREIGLRLERDRFAAHGCCVVIAAAEKACPECRR